jgi:hypothetical protein
MNTCRLGDDAALPRSAPFLGSDAVAALSGSAGEDLPVGVDPRRGTGSASSFGKTGARRASRAAWPSATPRLRSAVEVRSRASAKRATVGEGAAARWPRRVAPEPEVDGVDLVRHRREPLALRSFCRSTRATRNPRCRGRGRSHRVRARERSQYSAMQSCGSICVCTD